MSYSILKTERLTLNRLINEDWSMISYLRSDPIINTYVKRPPAHSKEEAIAFIHKINRGITNKNWYFWAIRQQKSPELIGTICLWNFSDDKKTAEVGYDLSPNFQQKGLMSESLKAVLDFGFDILDLDCIEAYTHINNLSSLHLLQKFNFKLNPDKQDANNKNNIVYSLNKHF